MDSKASKIYFKLGYFRILHSQPDLAAVDIYINDKIVAENLNFSSYTVYFPMFGEEYKISLYLAGTEDTPILIQNVRIDGDDLMTLAIVKAENTISLWSIPDKDMTTQPDMAMFRLVHLSPNTPAVNVTLTDGTILFQNVMYLYRTIYIYEQPSNVTMQIRLTDSSAVLLTIPNVNLEANEYKTLYVIGLMEQNPELEALLLLDGFK